MLFFICTSFAALNQVQKNLTDCYDTNSEIIYNKNIKRITVMLNPTGKKECQIFPRGIEASLVLYDGAVKNVLQAVVNDFNYSVTREIAFDLVSTEDVTVIIPGVSWQYNGQFYLSLDDIPNCVDLPNYN